MNLLKEFTWQQKVLELHKLNKFEEALQLVTEEEKKTPLSYDVLSSKATLLGILERNEESLKFAEKAIASNNPSESGVYNDVEIYNTKGLALYGLERYEEAIVAFDKCINLEPNFALAKQTKIYALMSLNKFHDAVLTYEKSDMPELKEYIWLNNLGFMYIESDFHDKAIPLLLSSLQVNPFQNEAYYNLARTQKHFRNQKGYFVWNSIFLFMKILNKLSLLEKLTKWFGIKMPHMREARFYRGSGKLFISNPHKRETHAIIKMLRNMTNSMALCNGTWNWFAMNIPYGIKNSKFSGDIDIIISRPRYFMGRDAGFSYRGFQVKTIVADKNGKTSSEKKGFARLKKIKKQLDILQKFGCEQVFLLELYVLERGHSSLNEFPPKNMRQEIIQRAKYLKKHGYGYVIMAEEPSPTIYDESGGLVHTPINILPAKPQIISAEFQILADSIDAFHKEPSFVPRVKSRGLAVISYCPKCKNLCYVVPTDYMTDVCSRCGENF